MEENKMKSAIYPGTFDPISNGHLDIIKRALKIFDRIIVAVGENKGKNPLFSAAERVAMIREVTKGMDVEVESFDGLLVDYAKKKKCTRIIRSLRAVSDFEYEFQMNVLNRQMNPELETLFLMTDKEYFYLSSSAIKEIAIKGGNISSMVPKAVEKRIREKLK
jgi:pantetheine-phosphate adenylyltransferase